MNQELPDVSLGFTKGRGTRDQITNIYWIIEKAREFQKNIYLCFIDYVKAFDYVDHNKLWKILKEMGIQPLYLSPEQVKKQQLEPYMEQLTGSKLRKEYNKAIYCHPVCLTTCRAYHVKCQLNKVQAGVKIARSNISNFRYVDNTTLTAEREKELRISQ